MYDILNEPLVAFWSYDLYPFTLHGTVVSTDAEGYVKTKEHSGYRFKSKAVMTQVRASSAIAALENLKQMRLRALAVVEREYAIELMELGEKYGIPMPNHVMEKAK